jgi:hypothetical protein
VADEVIDGPVAVSPRIMTLEGKQGVMYQAFESMLPGSGVVTSVEWTATGGTIAPNGAYSSTSLGAFKVIGRRKGNPKNPPDTSTVTVVPPQPTLAAVVVSPSSANLIAGQTQQFTASGKLSDGSSVAIGVTWTTTGGTIDVGGLYAAPNTAGTFKVIATHVTTGLADTANVTVTAISSIDLTPESATLSAGGSQQFTTTGTLSDGSTKTITNVFYSASGGSITSSGLYKAPSTAGTYTVTAKLAAAGGTLPTSTSTVTVTGSTSTASGATLPFVEDWRTYSSFSDWQSGTGLTRGWSALAAGTSWSQLAFDAGNAYPGLTRSLKLTFPAGGTCAQPSAGRYLNLASSSVKEVWIEFAIKWQAGWSTLPASSWGCTYAPDHKLLRGYFSDGDYFGLKDGHFGNQLSSSYPGDGPWDQGVGLSTPYYDGNWHIVRLHWKVSNTGQGIYYLAIDGKVITNWTSQTYPSDLPFERFVLGANMNNFPVNTQSFWIGYFKMWSTSPGW